DPLIGSGGSAEVVAEAAQIREKQGWDLAIAVTDLPLRGGGRVIVADASPAHGVGVVSLPALGVSRLRNRLTDAAVTLVRDVYESTHEVDDDTDLTSAAVPAGRITTPIQHMADNDISVRYGLPWRRGHVKLIAGLVRANRPWQILGAFKGALAATFATAAYALIFPSGWKLSAAMGGLRPAVITALAIVLMISWVIVAHNLWERPTARHKTDMTLVRLYNTVTVVTLFTVTVVGYIVLFAVIFGLAWLFIPQHYFAEELGSAYATAGGYLHLTWLLASLAMLAAALGQGLDDDETVRRATFGYRQNIRARQQQREDSDPYQGRTDDQR
ncbi:MAG: hypothetical protein ACRDMV_11830, partial [Streptosporangiales bacterium]